MNSQWSPPSTDLKTPLPEIELRALAWSPPPTQTICGFDGAMATAPVASMSTPSVTLVQGVPAFFVRHRPPLRLAAKILYRWSRTGVSGTSIALIHAAVRKAPMFLIVMPLRRPSSVAWFAADVAGGAAGV